MSTSTYTLPDLLRKWAQGDLKFVSLCNRFTDLEKCVRQLEQPPLKSKP